MSNVIPFRRPAGDAAPAASSDTPWGFLALLLVGFGVLEAIKLASGTHDPVTLPGSRMIRRNPSGFLPVVYGMDMLARIARQPDRRVLFYVGESLPMERDISRLKRDGLIELYNDTVTQPLSGPKVRLTAEGRRQLGAHIAKTQLWRR